MIIEPAAGAGGRAGAVLPSDRPTPDARRRQIVELGVVLLLLGPSIGLSFFAVQQGKLSFWLVATSAILRDLGMLVLLAYFAWINGERPRDLGWRFERGWVDALLGAALFLPLTLSASLLDRALEHIGIPGPATPQPSLLTVADVPEALLATLLVVVVAVTEETLFRGYLIRRLSLISSTAVFVVATSSVIFALGHGYEGASGVITVGYMGAVFAIVYLWRRSLVAPGVMHFLQDFLAIVLIPLLR